MTVTDPGRAGLVPGSTAWFPPALPRWLREVGVGNLIATVVLVAGALSLSASQTSVGGLWTYPAVLLAVLPLLAMRRHPVLAPVAVAVFTLLAQLAVGPIVTCGVILPACFIMAFQLGSRPIALPWIAGGGAGLTAALVVELLLDPVLGTVDAAVFMFALATTFFVGGLLIRSRVRMAETLRRRTVELAEERERTANLAVAADRERIGENLEVAIRSRVAAVAEAATSARERRGPDRPNENAAQTRATTIAALVEIEEHGRQTLAVMRDVVGTLRDAPTEPPPGIADLAELLRRATGADARLRVSGDVRSLGPNLELLAYRIVEQLLETLADDLLARITVAISFSTAALRLDVCGPARPEDTRDDAAHVAAALAAARTRTEVVGGRLESALVQRRREVSVVLPVPAGR